MIADWYDNEKRDGRSQMMKGNGTMTDLTPSTRTLIFSVGF